MELVEQLEQVAVWRDVAHRAAVVAIADLPGMVEHDERGHASETEEPDLLTVAIRDAVPGIGEPGEGEGVLLPIVAERRGGIGRNREDRCAARLEVVVVVAQLREVPAAVGSAQATEEDEDDWLPPAEVAEPHGCAVRVGQGEVGRRLRIASVHRHCRSTLLSIAFWRA